MEHLLPKEEEQVNGKTGQGTREEKNQELGNFYQGKNGYFHFGGPELGFGWELTLFRTVKPFPKENFRVLHILGNVETNFWRTHQILFRRTP